MAGLQPPSWAQNMRPRGAASITRILYNNMQGHGKPGRFTRKVCKVVSKPPGQKGPWVPVSTHPISVYFSSFVTPHYFNISSSLAERSIPVQVEDSWHGGLISVPRATHTFSYRSSQNSHNKGKMFLLVSSPRSH